jgi:hypothetical protein
LLSANVLVDGVRVAQGWAFGSAQGGTGSSSFGDDYLAFSFTERVYPQVGKGLPDRVVARRREL